MADTAEKIQNLNIQDFDGSDFDPYSPGNNKMESVPNGEQVQTMDLLGGFSDQGHVNGTDKHVSFDQDAGIGLPDPSYISQGQGQRNNIQRHMSEGEILGYQNEYGEMSSHQGEYHGDGDREDQNNIENDEGTDLDQVGDDHQSQGHSNSGEYSSPDRDSSQNDYDQYVENDYVEENPSGVDIHKEYVEEAFDGGYENDDIDPDNWQPEMDPERLRRSLSPERSVSPMVRNNQSNIEHDSVSEVSQPQAVGGVSEASTIPISPDYTESADLVSQSSQMMSETDSLDSRSECEGTPRRRRIPKPKRSLELPPWDDNVVIPPMPRMKPTLIGKQADVAPMSPPPRLQRPRTAPARHSAKDASSDSGVEEDKSSMRQNSADTKRKYGTDTKNERYKPGGGNIQVFHQKMIDTKYVAPRTDTTKPKSALMSPRISPSKEKATTPKPPTPNTKSVQSKIGSLNNMKHTPGGGNIKVLNAKVDFSSVSSKVGSKDKIHHQPKGGDKKIESRKLTWQTESKVDSLKNVTHSPGGGNVKVCKAEVHQTVNTEEDMSDILADNISNVKHHRRVDATLHRRTNSISLTNCPNGIDDSLQNFGTILEPVHESFFTRRILEPVPEVEYQSIDDTTKTNADQDQIHSSLSELIEEEMKGRKTELGQAQQCYYRDECIEDEEDMINEENKDQSASTPKVKGHLNETYDWDWKQGPPLPPKLTRNISDHEQLEEADNDDDQNVEHLSNEEGEITSVTSDHEELVVEKNMQSHPSLMNKIDSDDNSDIEDESDNGYKVLEDRNEKVESQKVFSNDNEIYHDIPLNDVVSDSSIRTAGNTSLEDLNEPDKTNGYSSVIERKSGFVNKIKAMFCSKERQTKMKCNANLTPSKSSCKSKDSDLAVNKCVKEKGEHFSVTLEQEIEIMTDGYNSDSFVERYNNTGGQVVDFGEAKKGKRKQVIYKRQKESIFREDNNDDLMCKHTESEIEDNGNVIDSTKIETSQSLFESEFSVKYQGDCSEEFLYHEIPCNVPFPCNPNCEQNSISTGFHREADTANGSVVNANVLASEMNDVYDHPKACVKCLEINPNKHSRGIVNEAFVYDEVASDDSTASNDSDMEYDWTEDEIHKYTSIAELKINAAPKKGLQTTVFRYKTDQRQTSPLHEIRQEMIDCLHYSFPRVEEGMDLTNKENTLLDAKCSLKVAPAHDCFEYAVVKKKIGSESLESQQSQSALHDLKGSSGGEDIPAELSVLSGNNETNVIEASKGRTEPALQQSLNGRQSSEMVDNDHVESNDDMNAGETEGVNNNYEQCSNISALTYSKTEQNMSFIDELQTVLASIQGSDGSCLRSPRRREGTKSGPRPMTLKVPAKPLWVKDDAKGAEVSPAGKCGLQRILSEGKRSSKLGLTRSQSLMTKWPTVSDVGFLQGPCYLNNVNYLNLAHYNCLDRNSAGQLNFKSSTNSLQPNVINDEADKCLDKVALKSKCNGSIEDSAEVAEWFVKETDSVEKENTPFVEDCRNAAADRVLDSHEGLKSDMVTFALQNIACIVCA